MSLSNDELKEIRKLCEAANRNDYIGGAMALFNDMATPTRVLELLDEITLLKEQVKFGVDLYHALSEEIERLITNKRGTDEEK